MTGALFVLTLGALFLTAKRSGLLFGLGAMMLGYVAYGNKKNSFLRLVGLLIAALAAVMILSRFLAPVRIVIDRFLELGKDSSTINRLKMWQLALELFMKHPVIGIGWEGFKYQYYVNIGAQSSGAYEYLDAHNVYLQVLAETGITGFVLYCYCVFSTFITTLKLLRSKARILRDADKIAVLYAFMYQIYYILYCVTGNCLYDITFVHYAIAIGLVYGVYVKTVMSGRSYKREGFIYIGGKGSVLGEFEDIIDNVLSGKDGLGMESLYSEGFTFDIAPNDKGGLIGSKDGGGNFFDEFVNGTGPEFSVLLGDHPYTETLKNESFVKRSQNIILSRGKNCKYTNAGRPQFYPWDAKLNSPMQFIGTYRYDGYSSKDGSYFNNVVTDTKSITSLVYHIPFLKNHRREQNKAFGTTFQFYIWRSKK